MKSTKKSLLMSTISLVLCFAMLLGTTYAWFTDEVKSGVNKIVAGNLDVELLHQGKNDAQATSVADETKLFDDITLWEPGAYVYETFTVKNVGNLALKYSMALNVASYSSYNGHNLTEVLKVATLDSVPTNRSDITGGTALKDWSLNSNDVALNPAAEKTFTVAIYWEPTDNDNLYNMNNGRPQPLSVDLGVQLVATQLMSESDSFGTDYDGDATNPLDPVTAKDVQLLVKMSEAPTEDIQIANQGKVKSATVPKEAAAQIFNNLKETGEQDSDTVENNLTLSLNVEEKNTTEENTYSFDIDMTAIMESVVNGEKSTQTKQVENLPEFVEVQLEVGEGYLSVDGKHDGVAMTKVINKEAIASATSNSAGYYNYNSETGTVTIWTKTFSPFTFVGEVLKTDAELLEENPNYTCRIGNKGYVRPFGENTMEGKASSALKDAKSGDTIKMIADYTSTNDYFADQKVNNCEITVDLNGKKITMKNTFQPAQGIYTIIDTSESQAGEINKVALYNYQQDSYNTTLNVFAGKIGRISTAVPGSYNVNIYGGEIGYIELQDRAKGVYCHIEGGSVGTIALWNDIDVNAAVTLSEGYTLTGPSTSGSYNTYTVNKGE